MWERRERLDSHLVAAVWVWVSLYSTFTLLSPVFGQFCPQSETRMGLGLSQEEETAPHLTIQTLARTHTRTLVATTHIHTYKESTKSLPSL